jgi:Tfp pilus assembly protein PilO
MEALLKNIHWLFVLYLGLTIYENYEEHKGQLERLKVQIPIVTNKVNKAIKDKKQIEAYLASIEEAKENIELVAKEVEKIQKKFPEKISDAENLSLIRTLGEGLNMKEMALSPGTEDKRGFYFAKRYQFAATGTFLQMLLFLEKISQSDRLLNIYQISIDKASDIQKGRYQKIKAKILIEAYRYNPNYRESRGISEIEKEFASKSKKKVSKGKKGRKRKGRNRKKKRKKK